MFREIFDPIISRATTGLAGVLAGVGATTGQTETIVSGAIVLLGLFADLGIRQLLKKF